MDEVSPIPEAPLARCWWLKRLTIASAALLVALGAAWFAVDRYLAAKMQARLEQYRAGGQATSVEEVAPPFVPEEINAATVYKQAAASIVAGVDSPRQSSMEYDEEMPPVPQWMEMTRKAVEANPRALTLARRAMSFREGNWGTVFKSPLISVMLPGLASQRNLANLLADAAGYEHVIGNDAEAIALIRNLLHQSDMLRVEPVLVANLVGVGVENLGLHALGQFSGELRIAEAGPSSTGPTGADRKEVEALIKALLRRQPEKSMHKAVQLERLWAVDLRSTMLARSLVARPIHRKEVMIAWSRVDEIQRSLHQTGLPTPSEAPLRTGFGVSSPANAVVDPVVQLHTLRDTLLPSRIHEIIRQTQWIARAVATKLAMRLYHLDRGRYPDALADLVPAYLPEVPADPFAGDGRPVGYLLAEQGARPLLYSVGRDGKDQTSSGEATPPRTYLVGWQSTQSGRPDDQHLDLSTWVSGEPRKWKDWSINPEIDLSGLGLDFQSADEDANDADTPGDEQDGVEDGQ